MTIQFETEDGSTVFLPEVPAIPMDAEKARQALQRDRNIRRSHLYPLVDATAHFACSLLFAPQGCQAFDLPRAPWMLAIGDDLNIAWGPKAFPADSLDAAIKAADHGVMITSGPDPFPYRVVATVAVRDRKNALLIETLPHQKDPWQRRIEHVRGSDVLPITCCMPLPSKEDA